MKLRNFALAVIGTGAMLLPALASADTPGAHPGYLHARSDLRAVRMLLQVREEPNVTRHLMMASNEVEAAIREVDHAAAADRKDLRDSPPPQNMDRRGRFRKIVELLRESRADLGREEDNGWARGWRDAAYRHIDEALEHMHKAAIEQHWDHELGF
jgi:hypothetical protein